MVTLKEFKWTRFQRQILPGLLLGDAFLESQNQGKTYRLKFEYGQHQKDYLFHLYSIFQDWCSMPPTQKKNGNWFFQTRSCSSLTFYGKQFSTLNKKRCVPRLIGRLLHVEGLAYWYMDDGSIKSKQSKGCIFNTHAYSKEEVERLIGVLVEKFGLQAKLRLQRRHDLVYYTIYVSGHSYEDIRKLIFPLLIPSMHYKFPPPRKVA